MAMDHARNLHFHHLDAPVLRAPRIALVRVGRSERTDAVREKTLRCDPVVVDEGRDHCGSTAFGQLRVVREVSGADRMPDDEDVQPRIVLEDWK